MKMHHLESALSTVQTFTTPLVELEQYPTSPHLAARVAHTMHHTYDDISHNLILDLGCGTGMLSIACALVGEGCLMVGVDIDDGALETARENVRLLDVEHAVELVRGDVVGVDVVVMNPPFGTKRRGVDMAFLQMAVRMAGTAVYSMHKSATREFILRRAAAWGVQAEVLAQLRFDIGEMYKFHRCKSVDVEVDLWRFDTTGKKGNAEVGHVARPLDTVEDVRARMQSSRNRVKGRKKKAVGYHRGSRP